MYVGSRVILVSSVLFATGILVDCSVALFVRRSEGLRGIVGIVCGSSSIAGWKALLVSLFNHFIFILLIYKFHYHSFLSIFIINK